MTFFVHYSGPRLALRVRNQNSTMRTNFRGLRWYEPNPAFRTTGTFTPYAQTKVVQIPNILGDLEPFKAIGTVTFTLAGASTRWKRGESGIALVRVPRSDERPRHLPVGTIPLHRRRVDGNVVMDFNFAQNPPCAYNPYTTCPLPPQQNRLPIAIEAGEKKYRRRRDAVAAPSSKLPNWQVQRHGLASLARWSACPYCVRTRTASPSIAIPVAPSKTRRASGGRKNCRRVSNPTAHAQ